MNPGFEPLQLPNFLVSQKVAVDCLPGDGASWLVRRWLGLRLVHGVGTVEKEGRDLLISPLASIHSPMDAIGRLLPLGIPDWDIHTLARDMVAELDLQDVS